MPSPGDASLTARAAERRAADLLHEARAREHAGAVAEAIVRYDAAITLAERTGERPILAEALRRLAIVEHHRTESARARALCQRSYDVARQIGDDLLAAQALNTLGGLDLTTGSLEDARRTFLQALELGGWSRQLRARVHQNLGILANIQGQLSEALACYERSLAAYRDCGDEQGCAIAYHNLGMVSADRGRFEAAECYFREARALAERIGDGHLRGLCLVNQAELDVARQRFEDARQNAESALALFDQLDARASKAGAYRVIGMMYRETGRPALAEARLRSAMEVAGAAGSVLGAAEAAREMAVLYQAMGRNADALRMLHTAYRGFRRLDARVDLVHIGGKVAELQGTYLAMVREWGRSLETSDSYTFGHCERVAKNAVAVARALGLDEQEETTILLGAYLHDVGKLRVPHEILHKPGLLNPDEREIVQLHPIWGIELLSTVDFPWDLKPIIRWHHEHYDGTGYPDRLRGDDIPVSAQIVGLLDVYDALTTGRPYHAPLSRVEAVDRVLECRGWWSERVVGAFLDTVARPAED